MSYRLIDANAIAESYPEVNDMPCIYADLPRGLDVGQYDMRGIDELQDENAKLRELVADMRHGICMAYLRGRPLDPYQYESRLRDLGVEVDDG